MAAPQATFDPRLSSSNNLSDLRMLFDNGVHVSDCVVLLATKGVLSRPWCLLELHEAVLHQIPVIVLPVAQRSFDWDEARGLIEHLETRLPALNPGALGELSRVLGTDDLTALKANVLSALGRQHVEVLLKPSSREELAIAASRSHTSSMVGGYISRTASVVFPPRRASHNRLSHPSRIGTTTSTSTLSVHDRERTRIKLRLQWRPNGTNNQVLADVTDLCEQMAVATGRVLTWDAHPHTGGDSSGRTASGNSSGRTTASWPHPEAAVHIHAVCIVCCPTAKEVAHYLSRKVSDVLQHNNVLVVAEGSELASQVQEQGFSRSDVLLLLQTEKTLRCPRLLMSLYIAVEQEVPIIPLVLHGHGYDFAQAREMLADLRSSLDVADLAELEALLGASAVLPDARRTVEQLSTALLAHIPQLISVQFNPLGTGADVAGSLADLHHRILDSALRASSASTSTEDAVNDNVEFVLLPEPPPPPQPSRSRG